MKKSDAINLMNKLGADKTPFLFIINYKCDQFIIKKLEDVKQEDLLYSFNNKSNWKASNIEIKNKFFKAHPIQLNDYQKAFKHVMDNINFGNSYLTNLTFPSIIETNYDLEEIFNLSKAKYKLYIPDEFVVFSPEIFVQIENGTISSNPMKGTIDASIPNAEHIILSDPKETAEHNTIVDLIRNDLSIVAENVHVEKFRYIDKIKTNHKNLLQVSSKITGNLPKNYEKSIGEIIFKLLPAGSISGAPKEKTIQIINEAENYNRGFYTGVMGIFDGKNLDSAVMIRFIEKQNNQLIYKSGGGITSFSDLHKEYNELIDKIYIPL